ncbi:MAG: carbon storage regulator CsrA [Candidatus Peribacteraceae bacterium]|nr:carbon storage regulator CsrA [Candidatus Peribacteraceae bacterium]
MLVLSRKVTEKIMIGNGVVVTIVKIDGNQVRVGIEAPDEVLIYREEIFPTAGNGKQATKQVAQQQPVKSTPPPLSRGIRRAAKQNHSGSK